MPPVKEFHLAVLGTAAVGKTNLCERLIGQAFNRKSGHKPSLDETATKFSIEADSSAGLILFNFYDWGWEQKRRDQSINQELMRGSDGALFLYDVTDRRSMRDYSEFADWYQRAAGFDKPWLIVSNKNDQKKKAVQDGEGQALASKGDKRGYVAISLADDTGLDDLVGLLAKIMMADLNLTVKSFQRASDASIEWSNEIADRKTANLGLGLPPMKVKRILLVALNSSVIEKFTEVCTTSEYALEAVSSPDACEEEFAGGSTAEGGSPALPIAAIVVPPTSSESQQAKLKKLVDNHGVVFSVTIPRNVLSAVSAGSK